MRAAIYLRQSLDKTGEGLAVDRQRQDCEKEATHRGWEVVGTFADNDVSASSRKPRPAYVRMLEEVQAGRVDAVLVWDLDRLTRRPIEVEDWIRLHERHGVNLVTISEHIDLSTDNGRMYLRIKVAVARAEVERKAARQRRANLQAAQDGRRMGGRRPFGFELDMTIREAEAAAIRQAYQDVLAGVSLGQIARDWNAAGFCSLDQLTAMFMDGELTQGEFRRERARAQSKLATIEAQMADAGRTNVLKDLVQARDVRAVWGALGTERQRAVIEALMIVKIMSPGRGRKAFNPETVIIEPRI